MDPRRSSWGDISAFSRTSSSHDDELLVQKQVEQQLSSLRSRLIAREKENKKLQDKVTSLTTALEQSSIALSQRMELVTDTLVQVEHLEAQLSEAGKTLLTREMQTDDLMQQLKSQAKQMETSELERAHWESEYLRVEAQAAIMQQKLERLKVHSSEQETEIMSWKTKVNVALDSVQELRFNYAAEHKRAQEIADSANANRQTALENERRLLARVSKRDLKIQALQRELAAMRDAKSLSDVEKRMAVEKEKDLKADAAEEQLEKHKLVLSLREQLSAMSNSLETTQAKEVLSQREIFQLREALLVSEANRLTEYRRQEQLLRGKDKEIAHIWQKYSQLVSSTFSSHGDSNCSPVAAKANDCPTST